MDPIVSGAIIAFIAELIVAPLIVAFVGMKLNRFDEKREIARAERAEDKKHEREMHDAEHSIILSMSRTMLLDNYEKCMTKGYYTVDEREVYSALYEQYVKSGGNGIITAIAGRIRELPTEPPDDKGE
jgi:uncharacterized protein YeeX (DUF496 family)